MKKTKKIIRFRVCVFIKHWIERCFQDLLNRPVLKSIYDFIETSVQDTDLNQMVDPLKKSIADALMKKNLAPEIQKEPDMDIVMRISFSKTDEIQLAQHLTSETFSIYHKLKSSEFFNQVWNKPKTQHLAPNLVELINQFNSVSKWVSSCIVCEDKLRRRVKLLELFVKTAKQLRELNNFHLLFAFISGMNNAAVARLKWTIDKLPRNVRQMWIQLEQEMQIEGSFKNYRMAVEKATPPCLPYLGVHLQDLVFIEDGNPDMSGHLINWRKCVYVANIVNLIQIHQSTHYTFWVANSVELKYYIASLPKLPDKELYQRSLLCEPKNATRADIK